MEGRYKNIFISLSLPIIALVSFYLYKNKKKINFQNKKNQDFEVDNQKNLEMKQKDQIEGQNLSFSNSTENNLQNSITDENTVINEDYKIIKNEEKKILKEKIITNNNHLEKHESSNFYEKMNEKNLKKSNNIDIDENKNLKKVDNMGLMDLKKKEIVNEKILEENDLKNRNSSNKVTNMNSIVQLDEKKSIEKKDFDEKKEFEEKKNLQINDSSENKIEKSQNDTVVNSLIEQTNLLKENKILIKNDEMVNEKILDSIDKEKLVEQNGILEENLNECSKLEKDKSSINSDTSSENKNSDESLIVDNNLNQTAELKDSQVSKKIKSSYIFEIPQELCGLLIGRNRKFINTVMKSSNVIVKITNHPFILSLNLCVIYGTDAEINNALEIVRERFPLNKFPYLSLNPLDPSLINFEAIPLSSQLYLPEGVNCDVILSSFIDAGHLFLQQPTHPTFSLLNKLDEYMDSTYKFYDTPGIENLTIGIICAVPKNNHWFRAIIISIDEDNCTVRFLDYGGFMTVPVNSLRQVKRDFMSIPFQASECFLANVKPIDGKWSDEANEYFKKIAEKKILHSYIVNYTEDRIPLIYLYCVDKDPPFLINSKLVSEGFGTWFDEE